MSSLNDIMRFAFNKSGKCSIRVLGLLDRSWSGRLGGMKIVNDSLQHKDEPIIELVGMVRDLHSVRVGSIDNSTTLNVLVERGITVLPFDNERDGLQAIIDNQIDAFAYDQAVLKFLVSSQFSGQLRVLPDTFNPYYVSMGMPPNSPLRELIDRSLLKAMATPDWLKLMDRYLGPGR